MAVVVAAAAVSSSVEVAAVLAERQRHRRGGGGGGVGGSGSSGGGAVSSRASSSESATTALRCGATFIVDRQIEIKSEATARDQVQIDSFTHNAGNGRLRILFTTVTWCPSAFERHRSLWTGFPSPPNHDQKHDQGQVENKDLCQQTPDLSSIVAIETVHVKRLTHFYAPAQVRVSGLSVRWTCPLQNAARRFA